MRGQIGRNLPTDMGTCSIFLVIFEPPLKLDIIMFEKVAFLSEIKKILPTSFMDGP